MIDDRIRQQVLHAIAGAVGSDIRCDFRNALSARQLKLNALTGRLPPRNRGNMSPRHETLWLSSSGSGFWNISARRRRKPARIPFLESSPISYLTSYLATSYLACTFANAVLNLPRSPLQLSHKLRIILDDFDDHLRAAFRSSAWLPLDHAAIPQNRPTSDVQTIDALANRTWAMPID